MITLILGTSEGKKILSLLNEFTEDIAVTTATNYGGDLLKKYRYKILNTKPLDIEDLKLFLIDNKSTILVDASHPYAQVVTENAIKVCKELKIEYIRYERPSVSEGYKDDIVSVRNYDELNIKLLDVKGTILNTTGSNNIGKFMNMNLDNRIIHRVLPSTKVMEKCYELGVKTEDVIAIKGPISYQLNLAFIDEYNAKAIVLKDSGVEGGTEEKIKAAIDRKLKIFMLERTNPVYTNSFYEVEKLVEYIKLYLLGTK
ncbi:cobalt-precorrin-6A reductase [Clostridium folliculivorans]|uniref:Cobalt-precorrin-6A/precorrin-6x reductase n=1 Tax=Clostridium folliculivorans TaxID=2886038 RepID=A0A9W5Y451_9CLOT|nr:cobalt-precorrin-6A reductase [Clostridium folliculivorans]GKU26308.1 cobalt-precorrin-6A/precorrin-6x reductase [Clostridium folliculivorans]GKU31980.1 cobalt-precorrin-6A/precorrin-6x reductase [Clostridium folliculivorans]